MTALAKRRLLYAPGLELHDVRCSSRATAWSEPEPAAADGVVFVRRGCFRRRVHGVESVVEPGVVYFERAGEEQEVLHPCDGGDACTAVTLSAELVASLWGEPALPGHPAFTTAAVDLAHRVVLTSARLGDVSFGVEAVLGLVAGVLERAEPDRVASGRPATVAARRRLVGAAREALALAPDTGLLELAQRLAVSPHHLSRAFRDETGQTFSGYRNRLRVRCALERLGEGEPSLARLAADLGFSDHAHMTRVIRDDVGETPSALRTLLGAHEPIRL